MAAQRRFQPGKIRALRGLYKLSPEQMAILVRDRVPGSTLTGQTVRRLEKGENKPSGDVLEWLAETFGMPIGWLFEEADEPPPTAPRKRGRK